MLLKQLNPVHITILTIYVLVFQKLHFELATLLIYSNFNRVYSEENNFNLVIIASYLPISFFLFLSIFIPFCLFFLINRVIYTKHHTQTNHTFCYSHPCCQMYGQILKAHLV